MLLLLLPFAGWAETIKLLCIGNSFSRDAATVYLQPLMAAAGEDILIVNAGSAGASFHTAIDAIMNGTEYQEIRIIRDGVLSVMNDRPIVPIITGEAWDYVSVQQCSKYSGCYNTYSVLPKLLTLIQNYTGDNTKFIFHQTWPYADWYESAEFTQYNNDAEYMYQEIVNCTSSLQKDYPLIDRIVPSGTAVKNGRLNITTPKQLSKDGAHLDSLGCFVAACAWYESLTGRDVRDNPYMPNILSQTDVVTAKRCAHSAVVSPFSATEFPSDGADVTNTYGENSAPLYYTLDGVSLGFERPTIPGIYIVRRGSTTTRLLVRFSAP